MELNDIDRIKECLMQWLVNLSQNSNGLLEQWADLSEDLPDSLDKSIMLNEKDLTFQRLSRDGLNIENILRALQKIDEGTYGVCDECDRKIPVKRLIAMPDARLCISCQTELENEIA